MSIQMRISNICIFFEIFYNVTIPYVHNVTCKRDLAVSWVQKKERSVASIKYLLFGRSVWPKDYRKRGSWHLLN